MTPRIIYPTTKSYAKTITSFEQARNEQVSSVNKTKIQTCKRTTTNQMGGFRKFRHFNSNDRNKYHPFTKSKQTHHIP